MRRTALLLVLLSALSAAAKKKASTGTGKGGKKRTGPPELHPALYEEELKDDPSFLQRRVKFVNTMENYSPVMIVWAKPEPELGHMSIVNTLGPKQKSITITTPIRHTFYMTDVENEHHLIRWVTINESYVNGTEITTSRHRWPNEGFQGPAEDLCYGCGVTMLRMQQMRREYGSYEYDNRTFGGKLHMPLQKLCQFAQNAPYKLHPLKMIDACVATVGNWNVRALGIKDLLDQVPDPFMSTSELPNPPPEYPPWTGMILGCEDGPMPLCKADASLEHFVAVKKDVTRISRAFRKKLSKMPTAEIEAAVIQSTDDFTGEYHVDKFFKLLEPPEDETDPDAPPSVIIHEDL